MSTEVKLPVLGESVTEGTISRWLKAVGECLLFLHLLYNKRICNVMII